MDSPLAADGIATVVIRRWRIILKPRFTAVTDILLTAPTGNTYESTRVNAGKGAALQEK